MNDEQGRWPGYRVDLEAFDRLAGELPEVPGLRALSRTRRAAPRS